MPIKPQLHSHYTDVTEDQYIEEATSEYADPDCVHCQAGEPLYVARPESLKPNSPPRNELSILLTSSFPLVCSYTLQTSLVAITLLFVGRLGKEELAGVSLACLTANVTGWSVFQGLASALDTLCPQAYGAGLKRAVGLHTQRMSLLLLFISIPIGLFWYYSLPFLKLLVHDDEVCKLARDFLRILLWGCPGVGCFEAGKRLLQAQGHFAAGLYTFIVCIPVHICLTWYLVVHLKVGFEGAAISMSVTRNLVPFGLVIYSWLFTTGECWRKIDGKAFQNWMSMIKLAVPACVMVEVECIGFEVLTLLAGINGTAELCAQTLLVTLCGFIFKVPYSLGIAASTQIAELLGNGSADIAREVSKLALLLAGVIGSLIVVVLLYFRKELPYLFTNEEEVVALMLGAVPLLAVFTLIDAVAGVITGVIRGMGKQYIGALIQTLGYYVIGLPCSIFAAFSLGWHLSGLWAGISIAMLLICVLQGLYIYLLDWNSLVEEAKIRNALDWDT